jgi:hypothetical protein
MKHIDTLREADLIETATGPRRVNSLNVMPIRRIYERWVGKFEELWSPPAATQRDGGGTGGRCSGAPALQKPKKGLGVGWSQTVI